MDKHAPLKRSKELISLSKEHHQGLLFCWKIRQGLKKSVDIKIVAAYVQWFWNKSLASHFQTEEKYLLPLLTTDDELGIQLQEEHQHIEALININADIPDPSLLKEIADAVDKHIRFEERVLFPHIESKATDEQRAFLLKHLIELEKGPAEFEPAFWMQG